MKKNSFFKGIASLALVIIGLTMFAFIFQIFYPFKHLDLIDTYAEKQQLDPALVSSVIHAESRFKAQATSHKNAKGLMQIGESTAYWGAEELGINDFTFEKAYDPETNIMLGTWYLEKLINQFGDTSTALAAYNAGSGNVASWLSDTAYSDDGVTLKDIPFEETKNYVNKVNLSHKIYSFVFKAMDKCKNF